MDNNQINLLDIEVINGLKELGDEFLKEIFNLYFEQYPSLYQNIIDNFSQDNFVELSKAAHALKGASLNIGAKKIANICQDIENMVKENNTENLNTDLIVRIHETYLDTASEINRLLNIENPD